jgi:hypothetical protein
MKISEMLNRLDEISRRDFLKGAGATAGLVAIGAAGKAKAQNIDYNAWANHAVDKAITALRKFKSVLISPRRITFEEHVKNAVTRSINWYMSNTNAYNLEKVINDVTAIAYNAADQEGVGIGDLIGGEVTDNVAVKATNTFARAYVAAVEQKAAEYKQTVGQQQKQKQNIQQELGKLSESEYNALTRGVMLYIVSQKDNNPGFKEIQTALNNFIKAYDNKAQVNSLYKKLNELYNILQSNPDQFEKLKQGAYGISKKTVSDLNQLSAKNQEEFKEEEVDEAATPDAVKRIEQLIQYK